MATSAFEAPGTLVEAASAGLTRAGAARLDAIDSLRGLVIALMVLDHVRDYFNSGAMVNPTDPATTYPLLYATRWITHLCAPTFVFLAGVSIYLQKANGKAPGDLSRLLLTRGAWLLLLECTVVGFGFNFGEPFIFLQVIWAIGIGMICLSLISRLPAGAVLGLGISVIVLYPWAVPATAGATGILGILRTLAIAPGAIAGTPVFAIYVFVPWLAVMCLGFGLGPVLRLPAAARSRAILGIALGLLAAFAVMRTLNGFGDPAPWTAQPTLTRAVMAFFNVSKYPPSPDYIAVTLGISLLIFLALQRLRGPVAAVLLNFGRTPLFTYMAHIYIVHGLMLCVAIGMGMPAVATHFVEKELRGLLPADWGFSLGTVYLVWIFVIAALIPLSRWFAAVKRRRRDWWLSYL